MLPRRCFADRTDELAALADDIRNVIRVFEPPKGVLTLYYNMEEDHLLIKSI